MQASRVARTCLTHACLMYVTTLTQSESSTALFYTMMAELKDMADAAQPTLFHRLLKRLDEEGRLQRVYTQNIDGLEAKAGLSFGFHDEDHEAEAAGKRKRMPQRSKAFARSQSDSVLMGVSGTQEKVKPLFPRAIPLHGSLSTLSCALCSYTLPLGTETQKAQTALEQMRAGLPVWCEQCEAADDLRTAAGLRSRGVGRMKVDVVLYNGENDTAERVGACVERDLLGLRDPNEPMVPETPSEERARVRREQAMALRTQSLAAPVQPALKEEDEEVGDLSMNADELSADSVLGGAFFDDAPSAEAPKDEKASPAPQPSVDAPPKPEPAAQAPPPVVQKPKTRLKPLPPDLLIVAGTSLKVPGTKRIVREFAKACRARDGAADDSVTSPIRTVYLNYDFPAAAREWSGTFDVWIQGDVQQAALGLCAPCDASKDPLEAHRARHSWHTHTHHVEAATQAKKAADRAAARMQRTRSHSSSTAPSARPLSRSQSENAQPALRFASHKLSTARRAGKPRR